MTNNLTVIAPSTRELQALRMDLAATGNITRCIEAGFLKGTINSQQATGIKESLTRLVDYCKEQQEIIFQLQTKLAQTQQLTVCT
ncbi:MULTISPECIES: hypothetical protein [unclassified Spirosoma]|uniref:hypothetical protein n=1 Tax=unclassified Spirosoma TaxID=2621999 RepID=UPI000961C155|nr:MULTISPECIES: hypothetical protein [unclassified Spirosoma]MBN8820780.1 hypothetical protein [Spirosoma sp.]OJW76372.1 MAG: hypothetical protein BGO59_22900 [Spirosoma sp. 48-14]